MDFEFGCEECGTEKEKLFDTITNNKPTRLCSRCASLNDSIVLEDEKRKIQNKLLEKRQPKMQEAPKPVSYNDLWKRHQEVKKAREEKQKAELKQQLKESTMVLDEEKFVLDLEEQKQKEKKEIVEEISRDLSLTDKQNEILEFNLEAEKKVTLKEMLKNTFNKLKIKKNKTEKKVEIDNENQNN